MTGILKEFNASRGFGYIYIDNNPNKVFCHYTNFEYKPINIDDHVTFEVGQGTKGPQALHIKKVA